jgi:hypothetical protein
MRQSAFLFFALGLLNSFSAAQQQVKIRVLDGRNGRPVRSEINVDFFESDERGVAIGQRHNWRWLTPRADDDGLIHLRIEPTDKYLTVNPADSFDCRLRKKELRPVQPPLHSLGEIVQSGIALENHCGKAQVAPRPGELVLFVRPFDWWEKFFGGLFS